MIRVREFVTTALLALGASVAAGVTATAQVTIQQPAFGVTTAGGIVIVPDGGAAALGGVGASRQGRSSFGPPIPGLGTRAFGRSDGWSGMSVRATIIDFEAMEARLAEEAGEIPQADASAGRRSGASVEPPTFAEELAAIRAAAASPAEARRGVARACLDRGIAKLERGDLRLARSWLTSARRDGDAEVRATAAEKLAEIERRLAARPPRR